MSVNFNTISTEDSIITYECNICGEVFTIDYVEGSNFLYWDEDYKDLLPLCPHCGVREKY